MIATYIYPKQALNLMLNDFNCGKLKLIKMHLSQYIKLASEQAREMNELSSFGLSLIKLIIFL